MIYQSIIQPLVSNSTWRMVLLLVNQNPCKKNTNLHEILHDDFNVSIWLETKEEVVPFFKMILFWKGLSVMLHMFSWI